MSIKNREAMRAARKVVEARYPFAASKHVTHKKLRGWCIFLEPGDLDPFARSETLEGAWEAAAIALNRKDYVAERDKPQSVPEPKAEAVAVDQHGDFWEEAARRADALALSMRAAGRTTDSKIWRAIYHLIGAVDTRE